MNEIVKINPKAKAKGIMNINRAGSILTSMPFDQAVQFIKAELTGEPETAVIEGNLFMILVKRN